MATSDCVSPLELSVDGRSNSEPYEDKGFSSKSNSITSLELRNGVAVTHENNCKDTNEGEVKVKKKVNIFTEEPNETTALRKDSEVSDSLADKSVISNVTEKGLTMTGTVKRGKKAGQNLDVRLNMSREELEMLDANIAAKTQQTCFTCGVAAGPHVFLWSLLCFPIAVVVSSVYSFYMGTMMWYNVFTYVTEEARIIWRILLSPFLILFYPLFIVVCTVGLGFYAGLIQISWFLDNWVKEIMDLEKGFYGWLCSIVHLEDCSPYEVIVLTDIKVPSNTASQDTLAN